MKTNNLKAIRTRKGLTQVQIAIQAGVSTRAYQNYEADKRLPNVMVAQKIAKALGAEVSDLFGDRNDNSTE